jgi:hypothetical protein
VLKQCPICPRKFQPGVSFSNRGYRAPIAGFVTCSAECAKKLAVDPITGIDLQAKAATCKDCGGVLEAGSIIGVCRVCAIERNVRLRVRDLARKKLLRRKRRDAIIAYELSDLEVVE